MNPIPLPRCRASLLALLALTACSNTPNQPDPPTPDVAHVASQPAKRPAYTPASSPALGTAFSTRHASFTPIAFAELPGWSNAAVHESFAALAASCKALSKRAAWQAPCALAAQISPEDDTALRRLFEDNFHLYEVRDVGSQETQGIITGYYEPVLNGSRQRSARYAYPVHGVPADLLFLDARQVHDGQQIWLKLDKRQLVPVSADTAGARRYTLQLDGLTAGIRDKRYRVRIQRQDGQAFVRPYWSRQDIERRKLDAQVLAWVDDAYALYSMQIQGSGKIRLDVGGEILRVAYGEQNGHPFLPQVSGRDSATVGTAVKTRGLYTGSAINANSGPAPAQAGDEEVQRIIAALGGQAPTKPPPAQAQVSQVTSHDASVEAIIAALKGTGQPTKPAAQPIPQEAPLQAGAQPTGIPDPSYVFFRRIPDGPQGPLGALGVPLTAGNSIAVDPRTTPLGSPVFLSTTHAGSKQTIHRLVFAQDTGGAIRGAVRADLFWGSGAQAGQQAASMKVPGRMWLLLPRTQDITAMAASRTRSIGGMAAGPPADCVIADDELCTDD